ncbi:unnamed protein product [Dovyalis caffra]|uniref:Uncharacterized protein n=1 Tax=Dovyalis caffra TaxID=77055 RepID=A0AAV1SA62_9ROSI|nr:unnamed protein product [Dovyalis caffra]
MAPPNKLAEIGIEAFKLLEENIYRSVPKAMMPFHSTYQQQLSSPLVHCYTRETVDCNNTAQEYNGVNWETSG